MSELEVGLDHANRVNGEIQKTVKKLQQVLIEQQTCTEDEQRQKNEARECALSAERHANSLLSEIEEHKLTVEQAERVKCAAENELRDSANQVSLLNGMLVSVTTQKKRLENDLAVLQGDLEDSLSEVHSANDRANNASIESNRLAEELRHLKDHSAGLERAKKNHENQLKDLNSRLEEAEAAAAKGGKRLVQRLEQKIYEIQSELELEQKLSLENATQVKRNERKVRELTTALEEEKKNQMRTNDQVATLQNKIKAYKKQIEETEEIASMNLAKFRKAQHELTDSVERADQAEAQLAKQRVFNRSSASMSRDQSPARDMRASSMIRGGSVARR